MDIQRCDGRRRRGLSVRKHVSQYVLDDNEEEKGRLKRHFLRPFFLFSTFPTLLFALLTTQRPPSSTLHLVVVDVECLTSDFAFNSRAPRRRFPLTEFVPAPCFSRPPWTRSALFPVTPSTIVLPSLIFHPPIRRERRPLHPLKCTSPPSLNFSRSSPSQRSVHRCRRRHDSMEGGW
jgi:hypothetical protein